MQYVNVVLELLLQLHYVYKSTPKGADSLTSKYQNDDLFRFDQDMWK